MRASSPPATPETDYFQQASLLHLRGQTSEAERCLERVLAANAAHFGAHFLRGVMRHQEGKSQEALARFAQAIACNPAPQEAAMAHKNIAVVLMSAGRPGDAAEHCRTAIALFPEFAGGYLGLADALLGMGRFDEAIESYDTALALDKNLAAAHTNIGGALVRQKRAAEALPHYEAVIEMAPGQAEAYYNYALAFHALLRFEEAAAQYRKALALNGYYSDAHHNLGEVLRTLGRQGEAIGHFKRAIAHKPGSAEMHFRLGLALQEQGQVAEACQEHRRALALDPNLFKARFALCMAQLPVLYADETEIASCRSAYARELETIAGAARDQAGLLELADSIGSAQPFFLPYQGLNDRDLQSRYGALACRAMAARFPAATLASPPAPTEKVRIGIVSGFYFWHSNWKIPIRGWLSQLDRRRFEIYCYYTRTVRDDETKLAASLCDRFVNGPLPIESWRETILADAPHVLIYPEVGMDTTTAPLAAQRLAPVQCNSWGHPVTSGFPTLDYFISSEVMEPPDAQDHYTEQLILLPNLSIYYEPISVEPIPLDRAGRGLRPEATVFWCGQSLYKYLPQYDEVFARIADAVGDCQFVFVTSDTAHLGEEFRRRLERAFAAVGRKADEHCVLLSSMLREPFIATMGLCDINLDSIGWSGCNSTLECLLHDLPIVTLKGPLMRGRHTAAILELIGATDTIAESVDDYVAKAVRLATDRAWRSSVSKRIAFGKHRVYRDRAPITAFEDFLDRVVRQPSGAVTATNPPRD